MRGIGRIAGGVAAFVALGAWGLPAHAAAPPCGGWTAPDVTVQVSETPGGEPGTIGIPLAEGATEGAREVYVRGAAHGAVLFGGLCGGAAGEVSIEAPTRDDKGGSVPVRLRVGGLGAEAAPAGYLARRDADGAVHEIGRFEVRRPGLPELRVLQADAQGTVWLQALGRTVDVRFVLAESGKGATGDIGLVLGPFAGPAGQRATLTLDRTALALGKGESADLRLTGELVLPGDWTAQLTATWAGKSRTWPVTVRRPEPPAVTMDVAPPPVLTYEPLFAWLGFTPDPTPLTVDLVNPGRGTARVQGPLLTRLVSARGFGAPGADGDGVLVGGSTPPGALAPAPASSAAPATKATGAAAPSTAPAAQPTGAAVSPAVPAAPDSASVAAVPASGAWEELPAGVHRRVVPVPWPGAPGPWTGTLTVADEAGAPRTQSFVLHVKHGPLLCMVMLVLGTLASYFVHTWTSTGRKRNVAATNLARVARRVQALPAPAFRGALEDALADVRVAMDDDPAHEPTAALQEVARQATAVERAAALLDEVGALVAMVDEPAARRALDGELAPLRRRFDAGRLADLQLAESGRGRLEDAIEALRSRAVAAAQDAVRLLAQRLADTLGESWSSRREALLARIPAGESGSVAASLDAARAAFDALPPAAGELDVPALVARREALRAVAAQLAEALGSARLAEIVSLARPRWFGATPADDDAWAALRARIADQRAAGRAADAAATWAAALAEKGTRFGDALAALPGRAEEGAAIRAAAAEVVRVLPADPLAALAACDVLRAALDRAVADMGTSTRAPAGAVAVPAGPAVPAEVRWRADPVAEEARLLTERRRNDLRVFAISACVSLVAGLTTLWYGHDDFGTLTDYGAALLWGFGIQEAGRLTLPSLLRERLGMSGGNSSAL